METVQAQLKPLFNFNVISLKKIIIISVIVLSSITTWFTIQNSTKEQLYTSSNLYENLLRKVDASDSHAVEEIALNLISNYPKTPYAHLAGLIVATHAINANNVELAIERLRWVISASHKVLIRPIAVARLARLLLNEGKYEEVLTVLAENEPYSDSQLLLIENIRGDAYMKLGNKAAALDSYRYVSKHLTPATENSLLNYKLIDLGVKNGFSELANNNSNSSNNQDEVNKTT